MRIFIFTIVSLFLTLSNSYANKAYDIIKMVDDNARRIKNQKYEIYMKILNKDNSKRERYFDIIKKSDKFYDKTLFKFFKPNDVSGSKILSHRKITTTNNKIWIYIPAFRMIKEISDSDKNSSFMGSDFTYNDISGRDIDSYSYKLIPSTNNKIYVVKSTPKNNKLENIDYMIDIISKEYKSILAREYYSKNKIVKILENKNFVEDKGFYFSKNSIMKNKKTGGTTIISVLDNDFSSKIGRSIVEISSLK